MPDVEAYDVISTGHEEKASLVVQRQPLQLTTADIPFRDDFVRAHVDCDGLTGLLDVGVK